MDVFCRIVEFFSNPESWKDYIIPLFGPMIGVFGAFLVLHRQINKQESSEKEKESVQKRTLLDVIDLQNKLLIGQIKQLIDKIDTLKEEISIERINIREIDFYSSALKILTSISYEKAHSAFFSVWGRSEDALKAFSLFFTSINHFDQLLKETNISKDLFYSSSAKNDSEIGKAYYDHVLIIRGLVESGSEDVKSFLISEEFRNISIKDEYDKSRFFNYKRMVDKQQNFFEQNKILGADIIQSIVAVNRPYFQELSDIGSFKFDLEFFISNSKDRLKHLESFSKFFDEQNLLLVR